MFDGRVVYHALAGVCALVLIACAVAVVLILERW